MKNISNMPPAYRGTYATKLLLAAASSAIALVAATSAMAQTALPTTGPAGADANQAEEVVVTGIRGSLQRNLDIKRSAAGVVDAISSEDIGKFPDSNVAASLQRIPGVSIQRDGARGEATGITVRGFGGDFNETLYDGRRVSTATGGRSVDFSTVGSDFVGQLNVLKTPDVSLGASSIGATVNILFPKPFDHPGLRIVATASGSWQSDAKKVVPTGGLLFSDTFADDTFGILADFAYSRHDTQSNQAYINGFNFGYYAPCQLAGSTAVTCSPTDPASAAAGTPASNIKTVRGAFEQQYGLSQLYTKDERIDGRIALQWHPSDDITLTLDDNFSRQTVNQKSIGFGIWFNQGSLRNVQLDGNGVPLNFTQDGSQTDFNATTNSNVLQTNQTGLNVKWAVTDNFSVEADADYSKSWRNPDGRVNSRNGDVGYGFGIGPSLGILINGNSDKAIPTLNNYGVNGDESRWADTSVIGSHVTVNQAQKNTDTIKQGRLVAEWKQDNFSLKFGGSYLEDKYKFQGSDTFTNNFWQAYSGYGPASGSLGVPIPASLFTGTVSTAHWLPGYSGSLPGPLLRYDADAYQAYLGSLGNPQTKNIPGFNYSGSTVGNTFTGTFDVALSPGSVQVISERTWAAFVRTSYETDIAGMDFHMNAGAREEVTRISSSGIGRLPTTLTQGAGDPTLLTVSYTPSQNVTTKSSYAYFLPSIDMKLDITKNLDVRFDASRTLTRPNLNYLSPVTDVGSGQRLGSFTATGNNPTLKPYLSDNFDLTGEWYYRRNSYFAVDLFLKNVSNFIVSGVTRQSINNVLDPTTGQPAVFAVSARINGPNATVRGIEIAWQHVFGDSGFGFQANGTFVNTNKPYKRDDFSQSGFAVTGLANSANFVGFYDKHGFQARVAVNWRDEYLLQFGQAQNTGQFGAEPTFVNAQTQIDFSTSYDVTKRLTIFAEGLNLNNSTYSTHGRYKNQLLSAYSYGRRVTAGVRFHF
jgi:TonB-dependent receptor